MKLTLGSLDIANLLKKHVSNSFIMWLYKNRVDEELSTEESLFLRFPIPRHIRTFFWHPNSMLKQKTHYVNDLLNTLDNEAVLTEAIQNAGVLVGMHADEATESIVDW